MTTFGVTLLSGGLDSTTVTTYAIERCDVLTALTFSYGQSHIKEVDCAREIASHLGIAHKTIDISFLGDVAWYSALTSPDAFPMPKDSISRSSGVSIPITYVPLRNTIFVSLAAAYLESQVLHAIEVEGVKRDDVEARLYMAPNAIDYSGYPDCRPEFFEQIRETLRYGSKLGTQYGVPLQIETPIIHMSKAEIAKMGLAISAPLELTWSCYESGPVPCGACDSCILRASGFEDAGLVDPLLAGLGAD